MTSIQITGLCMILFGALGFLLTLFLVYRAYQKKLSEAYMAIGSMIGASMYIVYSGFHLLAA